MLRCVYQFHHPASWVREQDSNLHVFRTTVLHDNSFTSALALNKKQYKIHFVCISCEQGVIKGVSPMTNRLAGEGGIKPPRPDLESVSITFLSSVRISKCFGEQKNKGMEVVPHGYLPRGGRYWI